LTATDAVKFDQFTFIEALKQRLNVMDSTAFSLCMDNNVPILVFDLGDEHAIRKAILWRKNRHAGEELNTACGHRRSVVLRKFFGRIAESALEADGRLF
jgi:hypothetical protein